MDASILRAVVLMSMLVLAIAQADINPSYTNTVSNGNTLGQVDDVIDPSNTNHVVPNGHLISCDKHYVKGFVDSCYESCKRNFFTPTVITNIINNNNREKEYTLQGATPKISMLFNLLLNWYDIILSCIITSQNNTLKASSKFIKVEIHVCLTH
ncbi:unnamed protein product [Prunus armeniaca]